MLQFKNDSEERNEIKELKKYTIILTATYFDEVSFILSGRYRTTEVTFDEDNSALKDFIGKFN